MSQLEESMGKDGVKWRGVDTCQAADSFLFFRKLAGVCSVHVPLPPPPHPAAASFSPEKTVAVRISPLVSSVHHLERLLPFS